MDGADPITEILRGRDGVGTVVVLRDGRRLHVHNIAWGRDSGEPSDHITRNISPTPPGASIDFFQTAEVEVILDADTQTAIFER